MGNCSGKKSKNSMDTAQPTCGENEYVPPPRSRGDSVLDVVVLSCSEEEDTPKSQEVEMKLDIEKMLDNIMKKRILLDSKKLKLGKLVGQGKFGSVYEGRLLRKKETDLKVAVKTVNRASCSENDVEQFLEESLCMRGFHHKNVLSVIGMCTRNGWPYVVMPFMDNGDLKRYVSNKLRTFTMKALLSYTAQVAEGMTYLQEQGFIHRDLAARNCVVSAEGQVKVADFGLSRDIYVNEYYRVATMDLPLPVRWMALESMKSQIFTQKSDVWSFGVLMWEVLTRGREPYGGLDNVAVIVSVRNGKRLKQPDHLSDEIYNMMQKCWHEKPNERPDFGDISETLNDMLGHCNLDQ